MTAIDLTIPVCAHISELPSNIDTMGTRQGKKPPNFSVVEPEPPFTEPNEKVHVITKGTFLELPKPPCLSSLEPEPSVMPLAPTSFVKEDKTTKICSKTFRCCQKLKKTHT